MAGQGPEVKLAEFGYCHPKEMPGDVEVEVVDLETLRVVARRKVPKGEFFKRDGVISSIPVSIDDPQPTTPAEPSAVIKPE